MTNPTFRGRIKVAALKFSSYIFDEATSTPAHSSRVRWATTTATQPDQSAAQLQPMVTMDGAVQTAGVDEKGNSLIDDPGLQTAVESVVNKII